MFPHRSTLHSYLHQCSNSTEWLETPISFHSFLLCNYFLRVLITISKVFIAVSFHIFLFYSIFCNFRLYLFHRVSVSKTNFYKNFSYICTDFISISSQTVHFSTSFCSLQALPSGFPICFHFHPVSLIEGCVNKNCRLLHLFYFQSIGVSHAEGCIRNVAICVQKSLYWHFLATLYHDFNNNLLL